jgi:hypothetical protein
MEYSNLNLLKKCWIKKSYLSTKASLLKHSGVSKEREKFKYTNQISCRQFSVIFSSIDDVIFKVSEELNKT